MTDKICAISASHHLRKMLSVLTWRSDKHLHDLHATPYVVPYEVTDRGALSGYASCVVTNR